MNGRYTAVVVEDERLARLELCSLLAREPTIAVVGEAASVAEARSVIQRAKPDVVFLDVQLGSQSGFELLDDVDDTIDVIFVTAYERHAVRAFEINALDYLLKPVDGDRLHNAVRRIGAPVRNNDVPATLELDDRLFLQTGHRWRFVRVGDVTCIEAAGDFSRIHLSEGVQVMMHRSLRDWEQRLPYRSFVRIHRSTIVNLAFVTSVDEWSGQTFRVFVNGFAAPFRMSRRYAARLKV